MDQDERDNLVAQAIMKAKNDNMYITQDGTRLYVRLGNGHMLKFSPGQNFREMSDDEIAEFLVDEIAKLIEKGVIL